MSRRRDAPAHNYAKPVEKLPELSGEVSQALSNELGHDYLQGSGNQTLPKVYYIQHKKAYYRGQWNEGLPHGRGICIFQDGTYYQGNFKQGEAEDENGYLILFNGAVYKGNIKGSVITGAGQMKHKIGERDSYYYTGYWQEGKPQGYGRQEYGDGSKYEGYFQAGYKSCYDQSKSIQEKLEKYTRDGKLDRQSEYRSIGSGETYSGEFLKGKMHGFGEYYRAFKNVRYTGEFRHGKKQGKGSLHMDQGVLSGFFENDVINGQGKFEWSDGRVYIGSFLNSKFDGQGRIILPNGNVLKGSWSQGHNLSLSGVSST